MPSEDANSYEEVKKAVLARYDVSAETHRLRFRQDRKQVGESYKNWSDRLRDHFKRWIKAKAGIPVEELMMIDQFLHCVPEELAVWLMERKPKTLKEIAELADEYTLVRSRSNSRKAPTSAGGQPIEKDKPDAEKGSRDLPRSSRNNTRGLQCYQCGQFGHIWKQSPFGLACKRLQRGCLEFPKSKIPPQRTGGWTSNPDASRHRLQPDSGCCKIGTAIQD